MYARKEAEGIDWGKQWSNAISPLTNLGTDKQGNTNFNYLGAALLGGGTGLVTWALARLLGLKSGASLTAGLLGAFATAYYSLGRQKYGEGFNPFNMEQGKGIFGNIGNQVKNNLEQRRTEKLQKNLPADRQKMVQQQQVNQGTATVDPKTKQAVTNGTPVVRTNYGADIWTDPKYRNKQVPFTPEKYGTRINTKELTGRTQSDAVREGARRIRQYKENSNYDTFAFEPNRLTGDDSWRFSAYPKTTE